MQPQDQSTIYGLIGIAIGCGTLLILGWKFIGEYFKDKKDNNQKFIEGIVTSTMQALMREFKQDIHEFKISTEAEIKRFNDTVINIYKEIKK